MHQRKVAILKVMLVVIFFNLCKPSKSQADQRSDSDRSSSNYLNAIEELQKLLNKETASPDKIGIASAEKILFLNISDILYCEAQGGYTNVFLQDGSKILSSIALGDFECQLASQHFFRIHHSYLINMKRIREYQRNDGGYVTMENGKQ